ncbi:MAG: hypothetical protein H6644_00135 [Caldilineaceae bacterium]|nr:hypothetical protein [Caldilineaceae bacterium]
MSQEPVSGQQVVIHIEELVIHGVDVGSRRRLGAAVEAELARLLVQLGALAHLDASRTVDVVDAGAISLGPRPRAESTGAHIAGAVFHSLGGLTAAEPADTPASSPEKHVPD